MVIFFSISFCNAQELPKEQLSQFKYYKEIVYKNDTLKIVIKNPLLCPLRLNLFSSYLKDENVIDDSIKMVIEKQSFIEFKSYAKNIDVEKLNLKIGLVFGDINQPLIKNNLALPFLKGKEYKILQGQKGSYSHNDDYSRYAIDFAMQEGETIVAADDGFVVGVIKDYQHGGNDIKWQPYANFITIYHPHSGFFTQYVHLKQNGSLVKIGDDVKRNQPIGFSGLTGYGSGAHLHFNVLVPEKGKSLISVPFYFENNMDAKKLKRKSLVKN